MRYDRLYAIRAQRAVDTGLVDLEAFIDELRSMGMNDERIDQMILDDLLEGGPIFGKFFRSLGMAASDTTTVAHRTASSVGMSVGLAEQGAMKVLPGESVPIGAAQRMGKADRLTGPLKIGDTDIVELAKQGDPDALEYLEDITDYEALTWVCALKKTCARCLPLHGKTMTRKDWRQSGYGPGAMHPRCMCVFEPSAVSQSRQQHIAPLVRQGSPGAPKGSKRTIRSLTQQDVDKAVAAADAARATPQGRQILDRLGRVNGP